jgi:hypothetical protein
VSTFVPLVSAADATSALRVGSLVVNNDLFHPLRLAQEVATVDLLTMAVWTSGWDRAGTNRNMSCWSCHTTGRRCAPPAFAMRWPP